MIAISRQCSIGANKAVPISRAVVLKARYENNWDVLWHGAVRLSVHKQSSRYLHVILRKCILGQDKVPHTRMIVPPFLFSELCPFANRKKILYVP